MFAASIDDWVLSGSSDVSGSSTDVEQAFSSFTVSMLSVKSFVISGVRLGDRTGVLKPKMVSKKAQFFLTTDTFRLNNPSKCGIGVLMQNTVKLLLKSKYS